MLLREGGWYVTRKGVAVGPITRHRARALSAGYHWMHRSNGVVGFWTVDGKWSLSGFDHTHDLVAEHPYLPLQDGQKYRLRNGQIATIETAILWQDEKRSFISIVSGLLLCWDEKGRFNTPAVAIETEWDIVGRACSHAKPTTLVPYPLGLKHGTRYRLRCGLETSTMAARTHAGDFAAHVLNESGATSIVDQHWNAHGKHSATAFDVIGEAPKQVDPAVSVIHAIEHGDQGDRENKPKLKLKVGHRYRLRNGQITERMQPSGGRGWGKEFEFEASVGDIWCITWRADGSHDWRISSSPSKWDCIAEVDHLGHDKACGASQELGWLNIYRRKDGDSVILIGSMLHKTREIAHAEKLPGVEHIACIEIKFTPGEGL